MNRAPFWPVIGMYIVIETLTRDGRNLSVDYKISGLLVSRGSLPGHGTHGRLRDAECGTARLGVAHNHGYCREVTMDALRVIEELSSAVSIR
jgi:hypothetical protein